MPKRPSDSIASVFAALTSVFKAVPSDKLDDLRDSLEPFGSSAHEMPNRRELDMGVPVRMSGDGADDMVRRYADGARQTGLSAEYETLARELSVMRDEVAAMKASQSASEKALVAIGSLLAAQAKADFPESEEEDEDEENDKGEGEAKSRAMPILAVADLMATLAGKARSAAGAATPPNFMPTSPRTGAVMKSGVDLVDSCMRSGVGPDGNELSVDALNALSTYRARLSAVASGNLKPEQAAFGLRLPTGF